MTENIGVPQSRKVVLFIAMSMDGFIAGENDDLSFLSMVEKEGEDYGYSNFIKNVDTVIMGRKTYSWLMKQVPEFPHADRESYIITRSTTASIGKTHFYNGDLIRLVNELKVKSGNIIFVDGGSEIVNLLLKANLIDEFYISIIPVLLGGGVKLFNEGFEKQNVQILKVLNFETGLIQIHGRLYS